MIDTRKRAISLAGVAPGEASVCKSKTPKRNNAGRFQPIALSQAVVNSLIVNWLGAKLPCALMKPDYTLRPEFYQKGFKTSKFVVFNFEISDV